MGSRYFVGWVPTVTGHLSFTTIATGHFPTRCWRRELGKRLVAVQRRDLLDVLILYADSSEVMRFFREKLANLIVGISGRFWYLLDARESDDGEMLYGSIHMVPAANNGEFVKSLRHWLAASGNLADLEKINPSLRKASCYSVKFSLERGGKVTITPDDGNGDRQLQHVLANQIFFFLKDISHVHQHHHPSHDAITEVTEISNAADESKWIAETQFCLYRAIIRFKRFRNEKALFRAAGILAYAQSFDRTYGKGASPAKRFNVDELKESLAVGREEITHFRNRWISLTETFRAFFFGLFGLIATAALFARLDGPKDFEVDPAWMQLAQFVASNPGTAVAFTILLSFVWAFRSHQLDPSEFRVLRLFLRLVQGVRLRWAIVFNILVTIFLIILSYLFLTP